MFRILRFIVKLILGIIWKLILLALAILVAIIILWYCVESGNVDLTNLM